MDSLFNLVACIDVLVHGTYFTKKVSWKSRFKILKHFYEYQNS